MSRRYRGAVNDFKFQVQPINFDCMSKRSAVISDCLILQRSVAI